MLGFRWAGASLCRLRCSLAAAAVTLFCYCSSSAAQSAKTECCCARAAIWYTAAACKRFRDAYAQMQAPTKPGKLVHHHASTSEQELLLDAPRMRPGRTVAREDASRATRTLEKIGGHRQIDTRISVPSGRATAVWQRSARRRRRRDPSASQGCPREPVRTPALRHR